ncbi:MAG: hypothetical protein WCJ35_17880 [Planctomycetota bacterium]
MFPQMKFWGARKRPVVSCDRHHRKLRLESLETRRLLSAVPPLVATPPIVLAGMVGSDLVISASAPEVRVLITESAGVITVQGLTQSYIGSSPFAGTWGVQTNINATGNTSATFSSLVRDLKIKLSGYDSNLQIGDGTDAVTITRDLIISMPATTTAAELAKNYIASPSHLCIDLNGDTVGRNLTITVGVNGSQTAGEAAVIDVNNTIVGSPTTGNLTITTYGAFPDMVGLAGDTVNGNASVATGASNDLIAVVGTTIAGATTAGRLTISAGAGNNTVLLTDAFNDMIDSSLRTFVTSEPVFGDGDDGELVDECVSTLTDDLATASSLGAGSVVAHGVAIYTLGGNDLIDVHDATLTGGNLTITAGNGTNDGTHVIAVTDTYVDSVTGAYSSGAGNCFITGGTADDLVVISGLVVDSELRVKTGAGNDVVLADPDVAVVDAAILDFVANHPSGVFFDPTSAPPAGLDIDNLETEILDLTDTCGFMAYKAAFTTSDTVSNMSTITLSESAVKTTLSVTMGLGSDGLFISEVGVGTTDGTGTATLSVGALGKAADTIVVVGMGALGDALCGQPPKGQMNKFSLTTGNGDNTVVVSLDWAGLNVMGLDPNTTNGIDWALQNYISANPSIQASMNAIDQELATEAEAMLDNTANPYSLNTDFAYFYIGTGSGTGANVVTLSDICISTSTTNSLNVSMGGGDDYLYFYNNCWDGFANLNGGRGNNTLDENNGGNTGNNATIKNFQTVIPPSF